MDPVAAGEYKALRHVRRARMRWALAATVGSVLNAAVVDRADGAARTAAGLGVVALMLLAFAAIAWTQPVRVATPRMTAEFALLLVLSLGLALFILQTADGVWAEWRFTAAAAAATAPNWYTATAGLRRADGR